MPIEIYVIGTRDLEKRLDNVAGFFKSQRLLAMFEDAGQAYTLLAQAAAPKDTRFLARSINHRVEQFGTPKITLRVGFDGRAQRYAPHVEFGSGASPRSGVNRRWMHWFTNGPGGKTIQQPYGLQGQTGYTSNFATHVMHPGTRPQPFFLKHLPVIGSRMVLALRRLLLEMAGGAGPRV